LKNNLLALIFSVISLSCTAKSLHVEPVSDFQLENYLGTWYEIARIENSIEEGLSNVTATYGINKNGSIRVVNKGFNDEEGEWEEAEGRAYFNSAENVAHLDVTFFWPFYIDYIVFEFKDAKDGYAFVTSDSTDYLWLLARKPVVEEHVMQRFLMLAKQMKFKTSDLVFVSQKKYQQSGSSGRLVESALPLKEVESNLTNTK
jgi:apolipoprotein D and lipocalin family protein